MVGEMVEGMVGGMVGGRWLGRIVGSWLGMIRGKNREMVGGGEWLLTPLPTPHLHTYALQTPAATVNHWPWWRKQRLYTQHWSKPPKQ